MLLAALAWGTPHVEVAAETLVLKHNAWWVEDADPNSWGGDYFSLMPSVGLRLGLLQRPWQGRFSIGGTLTVRGTWFTVPSAEISDLMLEADLLWELRWRLADGPEAAWFATAPGLRGGVWFSGPWGDQWTWSPAFTGSFGVDLAKGRAFVELRHHIVATGTTVTLYAIDPADERNRIWNIGTASEVHLLAGARF